MRWTIFGDSPWLDRHLIRRAEIFCRPWKYDAPMVSMPFCPAEFDTLQVFTELARINFHEYSSAKWAEQGTPFKLSVLRDILEGLKTLQFGGYFISAIHTRSIHISHSYPSFISALCAGRPYQPFILMIHINYSYRLFISVIHVRPSY